MLAKHVQLLILTPIVTHTLVSFRTLHNQWVTCSVVSGSLDLSLSKKIGLRAICYYLTTTVLAVVLGIILVVSIHPGKGSDEGITKAGEARSVYTPDLLMDLPRLVPRFLITFSLHCMRTWFYKHFFFFLFFGYLYSFPRLKLGFIHASENSLMRLIVSSSSRGNFHSRKSARVT